MPTKRQERRAERQRQKETRRRHRQEAEWRMARDKARKAPPEPVQRISLPTSRRSLHDVLALSVIAQVLGAVDRDRL